MNESAFRRRNFFGGNDTMTEVVVTIVGVILIVLAVILVVAVLMQSAKNSRMSGVVSGGGAETFFGKYKGKTIDKKLNTLTLVLALVFVGVVVALYIIQPGRGKVDYGNQDDIFKNVTTAVTTVAGTNGDKEPEVTTGAATTAATTDKEPEVTTVEAPEK